ncbi:DEAD/DEAH box helicase [Hoeflea poritis]|uniref:DEAD/DEAH box helicase n=1 Tax=Hoeflea poritis TaxID=2993659 RepID=A0ABT4VQL0_9HYPH|nr:DEAD/DEAH box helicase [Hoeflea poritis]MDA4846974.1 DEAD/DEAH box helicase [Hoeflea poritis]
MSAFERVDPALAAALNQRGFTEFTPVQSAVLDKDHGDLLVSAQTGSGKTVAFGLAISRGVIDARNDAEGASPLALIVAPTRELALQVRREFEWLFERTGLRVSSCVGGMDPRSERRALERGVDIVVGTPGRLRDHITRGSLDTTELRTVVLDEADEMLDLGFREDLEFILDAAPQDRRTLMFSATLPRTVTALAKRYQRDAESISVHGERSHHADITYFAHVVAPNERENAVINLLRFHDAPRSIVFCGTRGEVKRLSSRLANRGFSAVALSGELSQSERSHALQSIRDGRARVCVATDVAARGIDLPELDLVVHADLPNDPETLLHRSGRTGRAGRKGVCAVVVGGDRKRSAERLVRGAKIKLTWIPAPSLDQITERDDDRLLNSAYLSGDPDDGERDLAGTLLQRYTAEQIAAAFCRMHRSFLPAAEEISVVAQDESEPKKTREFQDGVWFRISTGRKQKAEPRRLLPIICRSGGITRRSVGSIQIRNSYTLFEIDPDCVVAFWKKISDDGCVEPDLTIEHIGEYQPDESDVENNRRPDNPRKSRGKKHKRPENGRKPRGFKNKAKAKRPAAPKKKRAGKPKSA